MAREFIHLAAVLDRFTRRVLAWRASITPEADFCIEAIEEALARHGTPEIFNTDHGSQFASADFIKVLSTKKIKTSMDEKWNQCDKNLHRTPLADHRIQRGLPVRLCQHPASTCLDRPLSRLLRQPASTFIA
jgi:transposase InsO family protein